MLGCIPLHAYVSPLFLGLSCLLISSSILSISFPHSSTTYYIAGRIHAVQMKFGNSYMAVSITVVPAFDMDFLFGLDNLRRLRGEWGVRVYFFLLCVAESVPW